MIDPLVLGIDVGTSGVRAAALDEAGTTVAETAILMRAHGTDSRDPLVWKAAVRAVLAALLRQVEPQRIVALAVDGTSGTVMPVDGRGRPLARALMYNDRVEDKDILRAVAAVAPETSAAHGPTSGLAKAISLQNTPGVAKVIHQADWIAGLFCGRFDISDENNALKTGYDPVFRKWPDWLARAGARSEWLPAIVPAGTPVGHVTKQASDTFGLAENTFVVAGTTDGCASFLATGAEQAGDAVTALGSTLTVKLLSDRPIFAPQFGIYSHRVGDVWLAGGASNTGGAVLAHFFPAERIAELSRSIDPAVETGLDYYPLLARGERFPIADPDMEPRLSPRPAHDAEFLKAMLEGIAAVEALAYGRLAELGAPMLRSVRTVGGGAKNATWTRVRKRKLKVPFLAALSEEAAAGAARLALKGARAAGLL